MATKSRSAGDLYYRVAFDRRAETHDVDDDGNYLGEWVQQFECRAGFTHLRGGESVMAGRLQGQHTQVIFVWASSQTRAVTTECRIRDLRAGHFDEDGNWSGVSFNIRDITPSDDRAWLDFLCVSGGADG